MTFVCVIMPGERIWCWMELGFRVEAVSPLRLVLGTDHSSGSGREACWARRRNFSGTRQFRRPLPTKSELSVVRPNSSHTDRTLSGIIQPVFTVGFRWLRVYCRTHRAIRRWFKDRSFLLFTSPRSRVPFISRASDTCRVEICAGPNAAVPLPLCHSPAHPCRSHPASAFADFYQRLARGTTILTVTWTSWWMMLWHCDIVWILQSHTLVG